MAEQDTVDTTESGYVPGKVLTPDQYSGGFVDFYKDYLGSTGVNVRDDDDDDDDDKDDYVAPNIANVGGDGAGDGQQFNLLSTSLGSNETYYDSKVSAVDLQSMDLSSKSWNDYKQSKGLADKSDFKRNAQITGGGLALAGTAGAMIGSAVLGKPTQTPWGTENYGAGMFAAIGNQVASMKYDALKEIQTLASIDDYEFTDIDGTSYSKGDGGYAIKVDGTTLVRSPGNSNYIGTLPMGMTNQQVLNLEAIQKGFLPSSSGISDRQGFGVSGLGGYTATGGFVDANGNSAAYGSYAALEALAEKDFGGSVKKAEQWLSEVRSGRSIFDFTPHMTAEEAKAIKDRINGVSSGVGTTPTTTTTGKPYGKDIDRFGRGRYTPAGMPTDTVYDIDTRSPDSRFDPRFSDFAPSTTFRDTVYDIDTRYSPFVDDTEYTGVTSGKAKEALTEAADRSARMQERERQDRRASVSDTMGSSTENNDTGGVGSSGDLGGGYGVGASTGAGSTSGIDGVETAAIQEAADSAGAGSESDKIVCTAMNNAYGFGSFRQTIWLKHSQNLDPAYQVGYHKIFKPLIKYAYKEDNLPNRIVKKWLEGVAKRRTADIWLQQRGKKRHLGGRIERAILEPICYIVGKI
jgi:hypothetical protein